MNTMPKLDDVLQRALWSEMKDPAEFRAYLKSAGYEILPTVPYNGSSLAKTTE